MGNCLCKDSPEELEACNDERNNEVPDSTAVSNHSTETIGFNSTIFKLPTSNNVDKLILETLGIIGTMIDK